MNLTTKDNPRKKTILLNDYNTHMESAKRAEELGFELNRRFHLGQAWGVVGSMLTCELIELPEYNQLVKQINEELFGK